MTVVDETARLPVVEIFQSVQGEGTRAGFPTTFVRLFNCNLRCRWCDTTYSYAPHQPAFFAAIGEIVEAVRRFGNPSVCLTGGEPLMHREKSLALVQALSELPGVEDLHIETNGAIPLAPFARLRQKGGKAARCLRFVMDWKLPGSGEAERMLAENLPLLGAQDELKFVIADERDFAAACALLDRFPTAALPLFSPVWETMPPARLVELLLASGRKQVKLSLQLHKVIWDPQTRGV